MEIPLLNEVAKLKAGAASGGGSGTQFTKLTQKDKKRYSVSNHSTSSRTEVGSIQYTRLSNHGGGQFSFAAIPYISYNGTNTQFYVTPFQVNQTTGAITTGTAGTVWSNGSGNCQTTMTWGQAGPYVFNIGGHCAPGYASNTGVVTAYGCAGNAVSGTYTISSAAWAPNNVDGAGVGSGSTYYFSGGSYDNNTGTAYRTVWSYNGSTLSNTVNSNPSAVTSTSYVSPVAPQYGSAAATTGSIRLWIDSNYSLQCDVLDSTLGVITTVNLESSFTDFEPYSTVTGTGLQLSNGRQLFYLTNGLILLRNGSSLSDVTSSADFIPLPRNVYRNSLTPASADTWYVFSGDNTGGGEIVKFSVNPTTYKVTVKGAFLVANSTLNNAGAFSGSYINYVGGPYITGSNNQFVVTANMYDSSPGHVTITVSEHSLTGA